MKRKIVIIFIFVLFFGGSICPGVIGSNEYVETDYIPYKTLSLKKNQYKNR